MTKEEFIADKKEAIGKEMITLRHSVNMIRRISKYPEPKKSVTNLKRAFRVMAHAMIVRNCVLHIKMIQAQPFLPPGGVDLVGGGMTPGRRIKPGEEVLPKEVVEKLQAGEVIHLIPNKNYDVTNSKI